MCVCLCVCVRARVCACVQEVSACNRHTIEGCTHRSLPPCRFSTHVPTSRTIFECQFRDLTAY